MYSFRKINDVWLSGSIAELYEESQRRKQDREEGYLALLEDSVR